MSVITSIKTFWHIFKNSAISAQYYKQLVFTKISLTAKYLSVLGIIYSVVTAGSIAYSITPKIHRSLDKLISIDQKAIPDDIKFVMKDGKWEFNKQEPFVLEWLKDNSKESQELPKNFLVLDHNGVLTDLKEKDTYMIMNSSNLLINLGKQDPAVYTLQSLPNVNMDKNGIIKTLDEIKTSLKLLPFIIFVMGFSATLLDFAFSRLIYFLMVAGLLQLNIWITGSKLKYDQTLRIAIHSATIPIVLELLLGLTPITLPDWASVWSPLLHMIIALSIIGKLKPVTTLNTQN